MRKCRLSRYDFLGRRECARALQLKHSDLLKCENGEKLLSKPIFDTWLQLVNSNDIEWRNAVMCLHGMAIKNPSDFAHKWRVLEVLGGPHDGKVVASLKTSSSTLNLYSEAVVLSNLVKVRTVHQYQICKDDMFLFHRGKVSQYEEVEESRE